MRYQLAGALCVATIGACTLNAQQLAPVHELGRRLAVSKDTLGSATEIRQLSDGRVLVNDVIKRRLLMYDSTLLHGVVVADSTTGTHNAYGMEPGGLIPYRDDTTLFVDATSVSLLVIGPNGRIVRVIAAPHPADLGSLVRYIRGGAGLDAKGRLVYEITGNSIGAAGAGSMSFKSAGLIASRNGLNTDGTPSTATQDSLSIVRVDLISRATDTIGLVAVPRTSPVSSKPAADGAGTITTTQVNPVPQPADGWALFADGSVAFVRASDYHIDWVNVDGTRNSTSKMAHHWERLTDSAKTAIVDSTRQFWAAFEARNDSVYKSHGQRRPYVQHFEVVDPSALGDYRQPFAEILPDLDNHIWIRQSSTPQSIGPVTDPAAAPVYDIVSRDGVVIDRIQLPPSLTLVGFGPGVAYLTSREGLGTVIVKYRIH